MDTPLKGLNSANTIYKTRGEALDACIDDLHRNPCVELSATGRVSIVESPTGRYFIVGFVESPEVYSLEYYVGPAGTGWVFDAIP